MFKDDTEIKNKVQNLYKAIKKANQQLEYIRKNVCKHSETKKVDYQWAPGHIISQATICSICGELLETPFELHNLKNTDNE